MSRPHIDWLLVSPVLLLLILGVTILRSVAPELIVNQLLFLGVSVFAFIFFSALDYQIIFALVVPEYFLSLVALLTPFIFGIATRGAVRWLQVGQFTLQPSELVKPFLLVAFVLIATSKRPGRFFLLLITGFIPLLVIFLQPDLGTTLVLGISWIVVLFSQIKLKLLLPLLAFMFLLALPVYRFGLHDYQRARLISFINPYQDPLGKGYHTIQSVIAVGSGQFFGRGLGQGTQSQLRFLPEHHTDFIFASLAEELGFFGAFLTLGLFCLIFWRIYIISKASKHPAVALFCLATLGMLAFQTFVNIGMNLGIMPITGITLPFISYGGSSLLSLGCIFGILNSISVTAFRQNYLEIY